MNLVIIYLDGFDCNFDKVNHQQKKVEKKIHSDYYVIMEDVTVGNNIEILQNHFVSDYDVIEVEQQDL